jgi:hypothetical protein
MNAKCLRHFRELASAAAPAFMLALFLLVLGALGGVHLVLLLTVLGPFLFLGSAPGTAFGLLRRASAA